MIFDTTQNTEYNESYLRSFYLLTLNYINTKDKMIANYVIGLTYIRKDFRPLA